jgi:hypothetical protein
MTELSPFQSTGQVGYGCKTWIAREIEEAHFGGLHYVWFSHQLNPLPPTGLSSNPLEIYRVIDYAVKTDDFDHPKIKDLRASLRVAVHQSIAPNNRLLARRLKKMIRRSNIEMFRPQLWRIDLSRIAVGRARAGRFGWDERLIRDLRQGEFSVIVE